jgi:hypothetical protein
VTVILDSGDAITFDALELVRATLDVTGPSALRVAA